MLDWCFSGPLLKPLLMATILSGRRLVLNWVLQLKYTGRIYLKDQAKPLGNQVHNFVLACILCWDISLYVFLHSTPSINPEISIRHYRVKIPCITLNISTCHILFSFISALNHKSLRLLLIFVHWYHFRNSGRRTLVLLWPYWFWKSLKSLWMLQLSTW